MNPYFPEFGEFENDTAENRLKYTSYVVEANSFEKHELWARHSGESIIDYTYRNGKPVYKDYQVEWKENSHGWLITVGHIYKRPICINVSWARLNGKLVMFYYPTSQMIDHVKITEWVKKYFVGNGVDFSLDRNWSCDAHDFHHCLDAIKKLNERE